MEVNFVVERMHSLFEWECWFYVAREIGWHQPLQYHLLFWCIIRPDTTRGRETGWACKHIEAMKTDCCSPVCHGTKVLKLCNQKTDCCSPVCHGMKVLKLYNQKTDCCIPVCHGMKVLNLYNQKTDLQSSMPRNEGLEIVQPVSKSLNVERNYGRQCMQQSFFEGRGWRVFLGQCCYWSEFLAWMPGCRPVKFSKVSLFWHQNLKSKKVIASKSEEKWEENVNVMYKNSKAMFVVSKLVSEF